MSVGTDTADHENNVEAIRESPSWEVGRGLFLGNDLRATANIVKHVMQTSLRKTMGLTTR